jgi:hypothetical protein
MSVLFAATYPEQSPRINNQTFMMRLVGPPLVVVEVAE